MRSFDYASAAPILILPPQDTPQKPFTMASNQSTFSSPLSTDLNNYPTIAACASFSNLTSAPSSTNRRKRSRDEAAINLEDEFPASHHLSAAPTENEDGWEYGQGMTITKPQGSGYIISPGSGTGTWAEEKVDEEKAKAAAAMLLHEQSVVRSAKCQKLNLTSTPAATEDFISSRALTTAINDSPATGDMEPTVDDFTRHLGIGWSLISSDEDVQAAARGWTRYINNHFPVTEAKIRLQSKGLASYLVEANEGYFLFGEALKQGRLVSRTLEQTFINLQGVSPIFESENTLIACSTPKVIDVITPSIEHSSMDAATVAGVPVVNHTLIGQSIEVDMDMS